MKSLYVKYCLSIALFAILFSSCDKTISNDDPFLGVRNEAVYIATDNHMLHCINTSNGSKFWETQLEGTCKGVPTIFDGKLYLGTDAGFVYRITLDSGKVEKKFPVGNPVVVSLVVDSKGIYVNTDSLYLYDINGNKKWSAISKPAISSAQKAGGYIYYACVDNIGDMFVESHDANNGALLWTSPTLALFTSLSGITTQVSSVRVSNGLVYVGSPNNKVYALNAADGSIKWSYTTNNKVLSSPVVYGGMCIVGSQDNNVYCIDTTSGLLRWKVSGSDRFSSSPTIYADKNLVLIGGYDYNMYAINHVDGTVSWKYPSGSIIQSSPVVYNSKMYFSSVDKYLYCVDCKTGLTIWKRFIGVPIANSPMVDDLSGGVYPTISGMSAN